MIEYKPLLDRAIDLAEHKLKRTINYQRPQPRGAYRGRDVDGAAEKKANPPAACR